MASATCVMVQALTVATTSCQCRKAEAKRTATLLPSMGSPVMHARRHKRRTLPIPWRGRGSGQRRSTREILAVRDPSDEGGQVGETRGCAGVGLLCDRNVPRPPIHFYLPAVDSKDTPGRYVTDSPHVQSMAARRDFNVGIRTGRKDRIGPRIEATVGQAIVQVDAHDAVAVEDEAHAVTCSAGRCGRERRPGTRVGTASATTLDSDGALGNVADPTVTVTQGGGQWADVGMVHAMGGDAAASGAVARIGSRNARERTVAVLACARVEHDQIVSRICNGCKSNSRNKRRRVGCCVPPLC